MPRFSVVHRVVCTSCGLTPLVEELETQRRFAQLMGGYTAPVATVPTNRIVRGTAAGAFTDGSGAYVMSAATTVGTTGSTLIVVLVNNETIGAISGMTWNGSPMTEIVPVFGPEYTMHYFAISNASAGTGSIVVDDSLGAVSHWTLFATEISGAAAASVDKTRGLSGTSTAPSSGTTSATTQAKEILVGAVWRKDPAVSGSFTASFQAGQTTGDGAVSMEECYLSVTSTGTYAAAKVGAVSSPWLAAIATFKVS